MSLFYTSAMTTADLPQLPADETSRLEELASYRILDTEAESDLDEIVTMAANIVGSSMATITFVDRDRQWFKAKVGVELDETPRAVAFCAHTVMHRAPLIVGDTHRDPRFATTRSASQADTGGSSPPQSGSNKNGPVRPLPARTAGRFSVGDDASVAIPKTGDEFMQLCARIAASLPKKLPTEQDVWWWQL